MPAVFGQSNIRGTWICEELAAPLIEGTTFTLLDLRDDSSKEQIFSAKAEWRKDGKRYDIKNYKDYVELTNKATSNYIARVYVVAITTIKITANRFEGFVNFSTIGGLEEAKVSFDYEWSEDLNTMRILIENKEYSYIKIGE